MPDPLALVITPTYNERESIVEVIAKLFDACGDRVDLLVIDDGSPDGTAEIVGNLATEDSRIHLEQRPGKLGLGTAYVAGFKWAMERGYDEVVEMDADLSHDPADVPRLLDALRDADLVIGSRYVPGGGVSNWGRGRRLLSAGGNLYARMWLGYKIKDSTAGFRAYRVAALTQIELDKIASEGYGFQIEMTRRFHKAGLRIREVPITFTERARGSSKMSRRIALEALTGVTRWGMRDRFSRSRRRTGTK